MKKRIIAVTLFCLMCGVTHAGGGLPALWARVYKAAIGQGKTAKEARVIAQKVCTPHLQKNMTELSSLRRNVLVNSGKSFLPSDRESAALNYVVNKYNIPGTSLLLNHRFLIENINPVSDYAEVRSKNHILYLQSKGENFIGAQKHKAFPIAGGTLAEIEKVLLFIEKLQIVSGSVKESLLFVVPEVLAIAEIPSSNKEFYLIARPSPKGVTLNDRLSRTIVGSDDKTRIFTYQESEIHFRQLFSTENNFNPYRLFELETGLKMLLKDFKIYNPHFLMNLEINVTSENWMRINFDRSLYYINSPGREGEAPLSDENVERFIRAWKHFYKNVYMIK